jgi:hypothetical protein
MRQDAKKILKIALLSVLFIFMAVYAFFNTRDLVFGVKIEDVVLVRGENEKVNIVTITGNAENAKVLTINGREISIDQAGNFNETIALILGYNTVTIRAEDKFGLQDEKNYQLTGK